MPDPRVRNVDARTVTVDTPSGPLTMPRTPEIDKHLQIEIGQAQIEPEPGPYRVEVGPAQIEPQYRAQIGPAQIEPSPPANSVNVPGVGNVRPPDPNDGIPQPPTSGRPLGYNDPRTRFVGQQGDHYLFIDPKRTHVDRTPVVDKVKNVISDDELKYRRISAIEPRETLINRQKELDSQMENELLAEYMGMMDA